MFDSFRKNRKIKKLHRDLIRRVRECKAELDDNRDIPISWQLVTLCRIWEGKEIIGSNGYPQAMLKGFAIQIQMCRDEEEFARSLSEWNIIEGG